jgi:hypothetical protein
MLGRSIISFGIAAVGIRREMKKIKNFRLLKRRAYRICSTCISFSTDNSLCIRSKKILDKPYSCMCDKWTKNPDKFKYIYF